MTWTRYGVMIIKKPLLLCLEERSWSRTNRIIREKKGLKTRETPVLSKVYGLTPRFSHLDFPAVVLVQHKMAKKIFSCPVDVRFPR